MIYSGKYKVTSPFGARILNGEPDDHRGIDVVGITNKTVTAVRPGVVGASTMITDRRNLTWQWGNYIRVDGDDGMRYYYCHLDRRLVLPGQRVKAGDTLGIEGNTGYSFSQHCHFEVRDENNLSVNPAPFLGIPNAVGTYGRDYRTEAQRRFGLSNATMKYLDLYIYADDLYRKMVEAE